jgi:hypothetical protein
MTWDALLRTAPAPAKQQASDLDKLHLRVFSTRDGKKLLAHLRGITIEQPTWYPGEDASHGYAREGQNSLVREIERRITRARESDD